MKSHFQWGCLLFFWPDTSTELDFKYWQSSPGQVRWRKDRFRETAGFNTIIADCACMHITKKKTKTKKAVDTEQVKW